MDDFKWLRPFGRQFGNGRREGAWHVGQRRLLDYLLVFFSKGAGEMVIGQESHSARPGDLFWIPPNTPHEMRGHPPFSEVSFIHFDLIYRSGGSDWDFTIPSGTLDLSVFGPMQHPTIPPGQLKNLCGKLTLHNAPRIGQLISNMASEAMASRPYSEFKISGLLMETLGDILTGLDANNLGQDNPFLPGLEEAANFLCESKSEPTVNEAASIAGLSPSHFRKLFKKRYQCSPKAWMKRSRIAKAKQLLCHPKINISQIAELCGFSNVHNFSRSFSQSEGISPRQYRQFSGKHFQVETQQGTLPSRRVPTI